MEVIVYALLYSRSVISIWDFESINLTYEASSPTVVRYPREALILACDIRSRNDWDLSTRDI